MSRRVSLKILREKANSVASLIKTKNLDFDSALKEVIGKKKVKKGVLQAFKGEVNKLVRTIPETTIKSIENEAETQRLSTSQKLSTPFLLGSIREATRRNENLLERNSNIALRETVRTLEKLDLNNHLEIIAEINRLREVHKIVDIFNLESSLSEIRNRTDYLVEEEDTYLRAAASSMLVSTNTGFQGFNIETFNGEEEENDFSLDEDSIEEETSEQAYPPMSELEALESESEKEDTLDFEAEKYLLEVFSVLNADEKLLFLESIYLNTDTEPKHLRKLSRCLASMTSDNDDKVDDFPIEETTSELINALERIGGTLHIQLIELNSKRLEKDDFDLPSLLDDTSSVLLEDDDDAEEAELNEKERVLEFEAKRQEVFTVTIEEKLLKPSIGEFLELYNIAACEQIRERLSLEAISITEDNDDKNFLAKMFLNDLDPEKSFPKEDGIRKYNALHHATSLLGKEAKPIIMESLRSNDIEVKCAAFDVLLNGRLTNNWGEQNLEKEIIESCRANKNPFLFGRLLLLSRENEGIPSGLRDSCIKMLKKVLSENSIDFATVMESLEEEKICTHEVGNVLEMHFKDLTDTNEIKLLPFSKRLLAESLKYEIFIDFAYDSKDSNPTLFNNAQVMIDTMLPEDKQERIETLQLLIAVSKSSKKLLALADLSKFGEDMNIERKFG